jgi:asparagine synthase (glutamine-hydrolysing)
MVSLQEHRGPDDRAVECPAPELCWGVVRLAIVDPLGAAQPLVGDEAGLRAVFNGEIYNHRELRAELAAQGYRFRTEGDGEVLLALYQRDPAGFAARLDGMFAFALWDARRGTLLLGRDRCGIKPLYYWADTQRVVFASEAKALLAHPGVPLAVDRSAIADYLDFRFVAPPKSAFAGVRKLPPGSVLSFGPGGGPSLHRYWHPRDAGGADPDFGAVLSAAVESTAREAETVSVFLSGGVDSATVAGLAARTREIETFSVGYGGSGWEDERPQAAEAAARAGVRNTEVVLAGAAVREVFTRTVWHMDEPVYTPTVLSNFALSARAAESGKVVLTGDGADELLLGYLPFRSAQRPGAWQPRYWRALGWLDADQRAKLVDPDAIGEFPAEIDAYTAGLTDAADPADRMRLFEFANKLPEYHLTRVDRAAMAHGLEARVPYLRNEVVSWALATPAARLLTPETKQPLRELAAAIGSPSARRPKQKFTAPAASWLSGPLRGLALELLRAADGAAELGLSPAGVAALAAGFEAAPEENTGTVWGVVVLLAWYQLVFERLRKLRGGRV